MIITKQDFISYLDNLSANELVELLEKSGFTYSEIIERLLTPPQLDMEFDRYREKEGDRCDVCREYFQNIDDLNEEDLCEDCADEVERKRLGIRED